MIRSGLLMRMPRTVIVTAEPLQALYISPLAERRHSRLFVTAEYCDAALLDHAISKRRPAWRLSPGISRVPRTRRAVRRNGLQLAGTRHGASCQTSAAGVPDACHPKNGSR